MSTPSTGNHNADDPNGSRAKHVDANAAPDADTTATERNPRQDPSPATRPVDSSATRADTADGARTRDGHPPRSDATVVTDGNAARTDGDNTRTRQHTAAVPVSHTKDPDEHRTVRDHDDRDPIPDAAEREALHQRQKETFGGMKFGSAFFGWLTATGMAVLLTALVAAAGTVVGLSTNTNLNDATDQATQDPQTVGITGAIILLVILLLAYFAGGYVAGRMARFNGAKQGLAVWLWALVVAVVAAILGLIFGPQFDVLASLNSFPRLPVNEGNLTTVGIIAVVIAAAAALAGAVLGGMAGMRYHRRIDRADFDDAASR